MIEMTIRSSNSVKAEREFFMVHLFRDWEIAVTTAPRQGQPLLNSTLASLQAAGWDYATIFAEPGSDLQAVSSVHTVHQNTERLWTWPQFLQAVRCGVAAGSNKIAVVQDDLQIAAGLRGFLDRTLTGQGVWSPYSPGMLAEHRIHEYGGGRGWIEVPHHFLRLRTHGACFYAMTAETARQLDQTVDRLMQRESPGRHRISTDGWMGKWCFDQKVPLFHHVPSLVQHVGEVSALDDRGRHTQLSNMRMATDFCQDANALP